MFVCDWLSRGREDSSICIKLFADVLLRDGQRHRYLPYDGAHGADKGEADALHLVEGHSGDGAGRWCRQTKRLDGHCGRGKIFLWLFCFAKSKNKTYQACQKPQP